jgi:hypothetical protein
MKIHPVEAGFFHMDRQTDMTKLMVAFRNVSNVPKNGPSRNGMGGMDWIDSVQDRGRWRTL